MKLFRANGATVMSVKQWGNGDERKAKLTSAGYDYGKVQARVNELMKNQ